MGKYLHDCPICGNPVIAKPHTPSDRYPTTCSPSCGARLRQLRRKPRRKGHRCPKCGGLNQQSMCFVCDRERRVSEKLLMLREVKQ